MQSPFDNIVQHLFHQPSLQSVTVDELERMTHEHPYFAAAQFLLLKKMQDTSHPHFKSQLHKTTLYFNNPLWLQFLLEPEAAPGFSISENPPFISNETTAVAVEEEKKVYAAGAHANTNNELLEAPVQTAGGIMDVITEVFNEPVVDEPAHISTSEHEPLKDEFTTNVLTAFEQNDIVANNYSEVPAANEAPVNTILQQSSEEYNETAALIVGAYNETENELEEKTADINEAALLSVSAYDKTELDTEEKSTDINEAAEIMVQAYDEVENYSEASTAEAEETAALTVHAYNEATIQSEEANNEVEEVAETIVQAYNDVQFEAENTFKEEQTQVEEPSADFTTEVVNENSLENAEQSDHEESILTENVPEPLNTWEEKPLLKTIIETPAATSDLLFEPYHTVDYFASQGIKLSKQEADSKDKFGKQLKSFTDWLKSMKKLPQASIENAMSKNEESKVVADAIHSIETREVITEAMAEVFEKQGMKDEAVGVYQKLSLLNPAKSAYFAAKIDHLKQ